MTTILFISSVAAAGLLGWVIGLWEGMCQAEKAIEGSRGIYWNQTDAIARPIQQPTHHVQLFDET